MTQRKYRIIKMFIGDKIPVVLEQTIIEPLCDEIFLQRDEKSFNALMRPDVKVFAVCFWYEKGKRPNFSYPVVRNLNIK